jgi:hypothetical protein
MFIDVTLFKKGDVRDNAVPHLCNIQSVRRPALINNSPRRARTKKYCCVITVASTSADQMVHRNKIIDSRRFAITMRLVAMHNLIALPVHQGKPHVFNERTTHQLFQEFSTS